MHLILVRSASILMAAMVLTVSGCGHISKPQVVGSGKAVTEKREVGPFTKVHAGGAVHVEVTIGEPPSLEVTADDNLVKHLLTEVDNGVLTVKSDVSYQTNLTVTVKATVKELTGIDLNGACHGKVAGIKSETFTADASGASKINLSGTVEKLSVKCNGASAVSAFDVTAQKVTAKANGASHIEITAKESLEADANGASTIRYAGAPPVNTVSVTAHGASSVTAK